MAEAGFKLPNGARDRERFLAMLERIESLEKRVAALEGGDDSAAPDFAGVDVRKDMVSRAVALGIGEESVIKKWPTDRIVKAVAKAEAGSTTAEAPEGGEE